MVSLFLFLSFALNCAQMPIRQYQRYLLQNRETFLKRAVNWANTFSHCHYFHHNHMSFPHGAFPELLTIGVHKIVDFEGHDDFTVLRKFWEKERDWLVGYLGYDLKNQVEKLESANPDALGNPDIGFYVPRHVLRFNQNMVDIFSYENPDDVFLTIDTYPPVNFLDTPVNISAEVPLTTRIRESQYLETVLGLRQHIEDGDLYEMNFCLEYAGKVKGLDPLHTYLRLVKKSPTPFSVYQKMDHQYLMCASPERFLKKEGNKLVSQPIKGTIRRGENALEDQHLKQQLAEDEKEIAENMMIVDLVRNDLARSCKPGTVQVEEFFGIYTFQQLHQMISTISGELRGDVHFIDALKYAFPMGSMTGAPKIKAMQLIERYEKSKRGLYSGAVGFIQPNGDFDFNVVIRSLLYNAKSSVLSFQVGSAITYDSQAEKEYQECLLKSLALFDVLGLSSTVPTQTAGRNSL